jgi:hypothetical protein
MTTSSFRTKSSFEMAAAVVAAVKVTMPVLETSELPGRASIRADALAAGAGWLVDWNRTLCACVYSARGVCQLRGAVGSGASSSSAPSGCRMTLGCERATHGASARGWIAWRLTRAAADRSIASRCGTE